MVFGRPSEYPSLGRGPETEESQGFCFRLTAVYWSSPGDLSMVQANYDDMLRRRLVYKDVGVSPGNVDIPETSPPKELESCSCSDVVS
jgi:hypothetical protein